MGPADQLDITGAKGGSSKPKTPVEAPDSLQSTNIGKILIAVGEGEFDGAPTDRDIFLDNTPIVDTSGNVNFPGVKWEWRPGSVEQDYIQGIPAIENETTVNVELRSDNPFARALSNTQLSAVRVRMVWPRLAQQDSSGNTNGYRIEYAIDIATDGGAYVEAHLGAVDGKTTNGYQRSVRVNLPKATSGWMLRVRRITPNANSGTVADTMTIAGYTEIIDQKLRYPNTALLYIEFDAQQFQNIPAVTVKCKAKRWPVPSNYDPIARTYTGVWDGTFKQAWTNNPAFVTYGVCVEDRFGLGKRIKSWMVDKWEMYRIAQYCDQQVPNGQGGLEPRFLCDMNLQGRAEAWSLLRDLSAIYRGMVYWAHGSLFMQADMPRAQDIDYVFTRANVIDGEFVYGGAERNTHYSRALVSYDNPANNYDTDVIPVTDNALQRRYRDRPVEISAIGCTRASEAQRRGKWALLSNSQDRTVTFKTGMEGRIPLPGYVIPVADELVAGRPNGGRISAAAGRVITLDRDTPIKAGDRLILNLPNGTAQARTVQSVAGRAVTVTTAYGVQPEPELQWAIDYDDLAVQLFRVLKTTRTQEGDYEITALEFNPSKFAAIDTGAKLDERPISVIPVTTVQPPASVTLSSAHMIDQGIAVSTMTIAWAAVEGAVAYDVEWRKDNGNWVSLQRVGTTSVDVVGIYAGAYLARVRAVSAFDIASIWKSSVLTQLNGKEGQPPAVTFLDTESLLFGIGIKWGFPAGAEDTQRTELWYSEGTDLGLATKLADLSYPQNEYVMQGLRAGQRFYFWARLVDRTGNIGPFFPVEGNLVTGAASADAGPILEQIAGEILESHLGQQLTEKIDLIDGNGPGSVNERVGTAKTELAQQISEVNNALATAKGNLEQQITATNQNVADAKSALEQQIAVVDGEVDAAKADLQQKIDSVSVLAGSLPYNKDKTYTTNQGVLGADSKLYQALKAVPKNTPPPNATYWTDVGQAIVTAAGTASRVSKVETDVSTLDGKSTAQATLIGGLQSGLTATNQNVTAAQQAADAANTLAGGKGKVIIQAAAPAVADRLAQNLWIDTTGNANTPKRWNGTTWVAVTDKAASDAAAAAQTALSQVALKADATVVNNVTTRVSEAEGKLSSQASRMDGMQTSIDGKASSQALQQVTSRVTATEQKDVAQDQQLSSQSSAIVSLTDSVSKKAEASTVQALSNEVNQHGQDLSAQGQSLTKINAALPLVGGENLVYNPSFDTPDPTTPLVADGWWYDSSSAPVSRAPSLVGSTLAPGFAQRLDVAGLTSSSWARVYGRANRRFKVVPGKTYTASVYMRGTAGLRILPQVYGVSADGVSSNSWAGVRVDASDTWTRLSVTFTADANTAQIYPAFVVYGGASASAGFIEGDQYQIEEGALATGWRDNGQVNSGNQASTATTVEALNAKVTQQGADLTSVSSKTTSLENSLATTNGNVTTAQQAAQAASDAAGAKGKVLYQSTAPAVADRLTQNLWIDTTANANTPKRWNGSAWVAVTDKVATDAAAAAQSALNQVATKADASAVQTLTNRVTNVEGTSTAQGQSLTALQASLTTTNQNVTAAQQAAQDASALAGGKGKVLVQSAAPSVADRLAQNLWIDTTGNANTPKRWTGTVWEAVSDKVATDAAAAASSALNQVQTKADASTVAALTNTVTQQGTNLAAQGQSLTNISASLGRVLSNSEKVYQSVFSDMATDSWVRTVTNPGTTITYEKTAGNVSGATMTLDSGSGNLNCWVASSRKVRFEPDRLYKLSGRVQQLSQGAGAARTYMGLDAFAEDGATRISASGANTHAGSHYVLMSAVTLPVGTWVEATIYVKGHTIGAESGAAGAGTITDPKRMKTGTAWISPMLITGYDAVGGKVSVDYFIIEDVTEQVQIDSNASATSALTSRVTQNEQGLASQSSLITNLQSGLTSTNGNVAAAQQAAQAASDLAGSKGKVIVQSAVPVTADRLAQNLWIDTTGNANTPKRWSGSAWVAVTDKVATDAAAAAQSALSQVATKAEASSLQALTNTVTQQGQQITADGQAITRIDASLTQVKADTAANAQATSALAGRVSANEAGITSASNQLTELNNSIGEVGGENLVYNSSFEKESTTPGVADEWWYDGTGEARTPSLVPSTVAPGRAQRLDVTGLGPSLWARVYVKSTRRFKVTPGKTYTASVYMRGTAGLRILLQVYGVNAAGSNTTSWGSTRTDASDTWVRLTHTFTVDAATDSVYPSVVVYGGANVSSGFIEADQYQMEAGTRASGWRDNGQVVALQQAATSAAVDLLSSKVTQQGSDLASVSSKTTSLENSLATTNGNVATAQQAAQAAADAAGAKGKVLYQSTAPAVADRLAQNLWIDTTGNANTPKRWNGTTWVAVTDKVATDAATAAQAALSQVALKADASALQTLGSTVSQQGATLNSQATSITQIKASMGQQPDNLILRGAFEDGVSDPWTAGPVIVGVSAHPSASKAIAFYGNSFCGLERNVLTKGGEQFDLSADIFAGYMTSGQMARMQMQFFDKAGAAISYLDAFAVVSGLGSFKAYAGRITAPAGAVSARFVTRLEPSDGSGRALWCNIVARRVSEAEAATANAVSSVTSTVNQQGEKLSAETQRIDVLSASVGSAQSAIQNEITARTNADSALSEQIQTTQSTLGETTASVQRVSTTLNQLNGVANASEVVKVQITANGIRHVAGFGLSIDNSKGAVQSTFAILANRFAILNPSGDAVSSPFAVVGNQTFISDAYIRDASIGNAKITNGAITTAKIGEAEVDTLRIRGNAVTIPVGAFAGSNTVSVTVTLDGNYAVFLQGSLTQTYQSDISMTRNGVLLWMERPRESSLASRGVMDYPGPGTHTYTLSSNHAGNTNGASILAVVCKR
ncbi:TipJ family phage tail tip protein [Pseudomonas monteilii]|uniref:TipJ family phage tail tip protein n=1 Tax=Pseudomonas monteilii TaxID=76759 RepID=UPI0034E270B8